MPIASISLSMLIEKNKRQPLETKSYHSHLPGQAGVDGGAGHVVSVRLQSPSAQNPLP